MVITKRMYLLYDTPIKPIAQQHEKRVRTIMINTNVVYPLIAVLSVSLGTISNAMLAIASASPESDRGNSSTVGAGGGESNQVEMAPEEDSSGTAPSEETPEDTEEPVEATEQPAAELPKCDGSPQECITENGDICLEGQGGHECECAEDMSDCPNHPSLRDPLPYCDLVDTNVQACSDRYDYDEENGLYPCNDGTQKANPLDCPDATAPSLEPSPSPEPGDNQCLALGCPGSPPDPENGCMDGRDPVDGLCLIGEPEPQTETREPLPYCDLIPRVAQDYSCHDRRDYDDVTGLYPCNDGTQKEDWQDCPDVSGADYEEFKHQEPIDPCLLDPDNSPTCPPPVDGQCPEGYNMNENGNCFPEHDRCPKEYHSHEDDESGRCIPDSTPCDEGYIMNPDFPSCDLKERVCEENPWLVACGGNGKDPDKDDDNGDDERHKVIINKINIHNTIHNTKDFPDVDIIGLSINDNGDAIVCMMSIDNGWVQCQEFGVPNDRINENIWRVIETDSNKDYDNGNTGSEDVDSAINGIKSQDFTELEDLDNHDFEIDLAALGINPQGDGLICLIEDDRNEGTALCEPFKVSNQAISGQITEITEILDD
jgi:hypothetical protein